MEARNDAYLGEDALDTEHQGQIDLLLMVEKELSGAADRAGSPRSSTNSSNSPIFIL